MWVCCMWFDMFCVYGEKRPKFRSLSIKKIEKPFGQRERGSDGVRLYQCLVIRQEAEGEMETCL